MASRRSPCTRIDAPRSSAVARRWYTASTLAVSRCPSPTRCSCAAMSSAHIAPTATSDPNASAERDVHPSHLGAELLGLTEEVESTLTWLTAKVEDLSKRIERQLPTGATGALHATQHCEVGVAATPHPRGYRSTAVADPTERLGHLHVGIGTLVNAGEHLQQMRLVQHQRSVQVLAGQGTNRGERCVRVDDVGELERQLLVGQSVEQPCVAHAGSAWTPVGTKAEDRRAPLRSHPAAAGTSAVRAATAAADLGQYPQQARPSVHQRVDATNVYHRLGNRGVPPLRCQERREQNAQFVGEGDAVDGSSR